MGLNACLPNNVIFFKLVEGDYFYDGMVKKVGLMINFSMFYLLYHFGQALVEVVG